MAALIAVRIDAYVAALHQKRQCFVVHWATMYLIDRDIGGRAIVMTNDSVETSSTYSG